MTQPNNITTAVDKEFKAEMAYKSFEAKIILKHNTIENKKPKTLEIYLDKVAGVVGVQRKKDLDI